MSKKLWMSERNKGLAVQSLAVIGFLSLILISILGVLLCLSFSFEEKISLQIDPIGILTLLVTAVLGMVVLRTLQRGDDSEKLERDLLIGTFKEFSTSFGRFIHKTASKGTIDPIKTANFFKQYGMDLQEMNELAIEEKFIQLHDTENLLKVFSRLKGAFDVPPAENEENHSHQTAFTEAVLRDIESMARDFKIALFKVIVIINRVER